MGFSEFKTTRSGREMIAAAVAGGKLSFTKIQMGDGRITSQSIYGLTGLISPVHDVEIASKEVKQGIDKNGETANYALIKGHFKKNELEKSFYFREIGVYAKIDDGEEKLITYNNAYDLADYIDKESAEIQDRTLVIPVFIGEVNEIDVVINVDMTYVTTEEFESHKEDKLLHLPSGGTEGQVPVRTKSGVEWGKAGDPEALDEHIKNKDIHVTKQEKETWNGKAGADHNHTAEDVGAAPVIHKHALSDLPITYGTTDLVAGTSQLTTDKIYLVYD